MRRIAFAVSLVVAPLLLPACTQTVAQRADADRRVAETQAKLAAALSGYTRGETASCIPLTLPDVHTTTYGPTILYRYGNRIYRNDTAGGCEGAARGDILVSVQHQGRPCSGDIIQTVEPLSHIPSGSCALNEFTTYTKR